jgi:hypothetical protein
MLARTSRDEQQRLLPRRLAGDRPAVVLLFHLGAIAFAGRDDDWAEALCHEAVALYDERGWRLDAIDLLRYLGLFACRRSDHERAAACFTENSRRLQNVAARRPS